MTMERGIASGIERHRELCCVRKTEEFTEGCKAQKRAGHQLRTYKITEKEKLQLFHEQGGRCKRCGKQWANPWGKDVHTDHVHGENGRPLVRGLLCGPCNTKLGVIEEYLYNLDGLKHATDQYLREGARSVILPATLERTS